MFQNKKANLILSLFITLALWGYVLLSVNPTVDQTFDGIPVKIQNQETLLQRGLTLSQDEYYVSVTVTGKRSDILKLTSEKIVAMMDVYGYALGTNYIPVKIELPPDIEIKSGSASKIEVVVEEYAVSNRPVEVSITGDIAQDEEVYIFSVNPLQVEVRGPKSKVASVKKLTAGMDLESMKDKESFTLNIVPVDSDDEIVKEVRLSSTNVNVEASLLSLKTVPLEVPVTGELEYSFELESFSIPNSVILAGPKDKLDLIENLVASPVDMSKISTTSTIPLKIPLPEGVYISTKGKAPEILIKIKGIETKTYDVETHNIVFENLGNEYSAYINTATVKMVISGETDVLNAIKVPQDIRLFLDLEGLKPGTYTMSVKIKYDAELQSLTITPKEVQVTINAVNEAF